MSMLGLQDMVDMLARKNGIRWYRHILRKNDNDVLRSRDVHYGTFRARVPNLFTILYHLDSPYCHRVPLLTEQLI